MLASGRWIRRGISVPPPQERSGQTRSLRQIAAELARFGHLAPSGNPYEAMSVRRMLER